MSAAASPFLGIAQCVTLTAFTAFGVKIQCLLYLADVEPLVSVLHFKTV